MATVMLTLMMMMTTTVSHVVNSNNCNPGCMCTCKVSRSTLCCCQVRSLEMFVFRNLRIVSQVSVRKTTAVS